MRFQKLELRAFGTFTDTSLDFSTNPSAIQLIYGPNEAGKSTALRAVRALLFGIPVQTPDSFLHDNQALRIGAELKRSNGEQLAFIRRKGRAKTLLDLEGNALADDALRPFLQGISESLFTSAFGLDHEILVKGGQDLAEGKGEIGEILFGAGLGLANLHEVLVKLEGEMEDLFKQKGQVQLLNKALSEFKGAAKASRESILPSDEYLGLQNSLTHSRTDASGIQGTLTQKSAARSRLLRICRAIPLITKLQMALKEREAFGDVPTLPPNFTERRITAQKERDTANYTCEALTQALHELETEVAELVVPVAILDQSPAITELSEHLSVHLKADRDGRDLETQAKHHRQDMQAAMQRLPEALRLASGEPPRVDVATKQRLLVLSGHAGKLEHASSVASQSVALHTRQLENLKEQQAHLAECRDTTNLQRALHRAQRLGEIEDRAEQLQASISKNERHVATALRQSMPAWEGARDLFETAPIPLRETIERYEAELADRKDVLKEAKRDADRTRKVIRALGEELRVSEAQRAYFFEIIEFDLTNLENSKAIVRFEASWPKDKKHASVKRTGGSVTVESPEIATKLLESLPITYLPALRDAEAALAPGYRSRLALLLRDLVNRTGAATREDILKIFAKANSDLIAVPHISDTANSLSERTEKIAGTDHSPSTIRAAEADFDKILRTLHVQMTDSPIGSLSANGLGFNNLLYIAVVLEHLKQDSLDECPLLLVEEPEAHLHPQLTMLLAEYLSKTTPGATTPQTLVTTHSPTLAASVPPSRVHVLFIAQHGGKTVCNSLAKAGMNQKEQGELQRMMDITRATLYFAKAVILVEGISESLLIPAIAARMGYDLTREHISVVPICGVAFETFKKLLHPHALGIPVAIISDADPKVTRGTTWETDLPENDGTSFKLCDRMNKLLHLFNGHATVKVFHSKLTLEYDLAEAGDGNAAVMAKAWESCFVGTPGTFNEVRVTNAGTARVDKAMVAWRGICRAEHTGSKAEFAHRLSAKLVGSDGSGQAPAPSCFKPPTYIREAIQYVVNSIKPPPVTGAGAAP